MPTSIVAILVTVLMRQVSNGYEILKRDLKTKIFGIFKPTCPKVKISLETSHMVDRIIHATVEFCIFQVQLIFFYM